MSLLDAGFLLLALAWVLLALFQSRQLRRPIQVQLNTTHLRSGDLVLVHVPEEFRPADMSGIAREISATAAQHGVEVIVFFGNDIQLDVRHSLPSEDGPSQTKEAAMNPSISMGFSAHNLDSHRTTRRGHGKVGTYAPCPARSMRPCQILRKIRSRIPMAPVCHGGARKEVEAA